MGEMVGGCCVCSDDHGWSENPLVYCDGQSCNVAVHQACYGIVTVPTGPWYCCKCESQERSVKVKCELCPSKYGALKRTDNQGWAHVVCALYIPEVRFGNVSTMEPIQLQLIPPERFNKVCYICENKGKASSATVGACMQCNKAGCKQQFHVTCAQSLGLLCEEAGNFLDNVKYCGYCQYHYSKLKKTINVKTIPPYKPISENHNSDSNSEKETEVGGVSVKRISPPPLTLQQPTTATGRRKSSSTVGGGGGGGGKNTNNSSKISNAFSGSSSKSTGLHQQKNSHKGPPEKKNSTSKSTKSDDLPSPQLLERKDSKSDNSFDSEREKEVIKSSRKRKVISRTPTPVQPNETVAVSNITQTLNVSLSTSPNVTTSSTTATNSMQQIERKNSINSADGTSEKLKKGKTEAATHHQSIIFNQPVVALTSISTVKLNVPSTISGETTVGHNNEQSVMLTDDQTTTQQPQSIGMSVPLTNISTNSQNSSSNSQSGLLSDGQSFSSEKVVPGVTSTNSTIMASDNDIPAVSGGGVEASARIGTLNKRLDASCTNDNLTPTSEMGNSASGLSLKSTYSAKQSNHNSNSNVEDMELELDDTPPPLLSLHNTEKRRRSLSNEKHSKRKSSNIINANSNSPPSQTDNSFISTNDSLSLPSKRSSNRLPQPSRSGAPQQQQLGAFSVISQEKIKDSPPSSPNSDHLSGGSTNQQPDGRNRNNKSRRSAPAAINATKDEKKVFQNGGIVTAPHMLGNQLNPNSSMHQKMADHLNAELEAHSVYSNSTNTTSPLLVGPQMPHKIIQSARTNSTGSSTASAGSGLSSVLGGGVGGGLGGGAIPQTLDQLLERQWEQGSQFLMEQAQHFDIASLLSCLHQLRAENLRLEEHVNTLIQRRDHLLAVNARLAIPLTGQPPPPASGAAQPPNSAIPSNIVPSHHPVNNIHPNMLMHHGGGGGDITPSSNTSHRSTRHNAINNSIYDRHHHQQQHLTPLENGLPDSYSQQRSPIATINQISQSPTTIRHSPATISYSNTTINSNLQRQATIDPNAGRITGGLSRSQLPSYSSNYERPGSSNSSHSSQQV